MTLPELLDPLLEKPLYVYWEQTRLLADGRLALVAEPRDRSRGARVYACNPDGSGLELLTPAEEDPLPIFVFPETGTPAFEWP